MFEASPRSEDVLAAKGALQWDFPGSVVAVPYDTYLEKDFLQSLCQYLEQASTESIKEFAAHSNKAGMVIVEDRDTKDPGLISSLLVAILDANGRRITPTLLRKRVRDDVLWHNSAVPWRRMPFWLVMRVAIQRHLIRQLSSSELDSDRARVEYKVFMCLLLARLLDDVHKSRPDRLDHLKAKLCRRLAKLEVEMETGSPEAVKFYKFYKSHLEKRLEESVLQATAALQLRWNTFKESSTRTILPLPRRAEPEALSLSFQAGSLQYLNHVLMRFRNSKFTARPRQQRQTSDSETPHSTDILEPYFKLAELESDLQHTYGILDGEFSYEWDACDIAKDIRRYIGNVGDLYDFSIEQKSMMILIVFELWMRLDLITCDNFPLLKDYHPSFSPEILNVLHLPHWTDMTRLREVQAYLRQRVEMSKTSRTIFDSPGEGCFAQRFFDEAPEAVRLRKLLDVIRKRASEDRQMKEDEWKEKNEAFESLTRQIERSVCSYLPDMIDSQSRRFPSPQHHDPACQKCAMTSQLRSMKIRIWEDPLPADDLMAKVAVFELGGYPDIEQYRDITWFIIMKLGTELVEESLPPMCSIREYVQLGEFARPSEPSLRLVSTTKSCKCPGFHYAGNE